MQKRARWSKAARREYGYQAAALRRGQDLLAQRKSLFWVCYDTACCLIIIAAMVIYFVYVFSLTPQLRLTKAPAIYDGDAVAPARPFLLRRCALRSGLAVHTTCARLARQTLSRAVPATSPHRLAETRRAPRRRTRCSG